MIELLNKSVTTKTGNAYKPAPNSSDFQDLPIDMVNSGPARYEDNLPS